MSMDLSNLSWSLKKVGDRVFFINKINPISGKKLTEENEIKKTFKKKALELGLIIPFPRCFCIYSCPSWQSIEQ
jgi:hypothetical protein